MRKKRDIILVDQRGTGGSNKLICKDSKGESAVVEDDDYGLDAAREFARRCAVDLSKKADLRFYSTTDAIQDLDDVRAAIGAEQINLMGVSYGTRVAQQYAKRYPAHTRTVTIDGIAPNSLILGNEHAKNLESSLDRQFGRCASDKACAEKLGNPAPTPGCADDAGESLAAHGSLPRRDHRRVEGRAAYRRPHRDAGAHVRLRAGRSRDCCRWN